MAFQPSKRRNKPLSDALPADSTPAPPQLCEEKLRLLFALLFSSPEAVTQDRIREVLYPAQAADADQPNSEGSQEEQSPREHLDALQQWMDDRDLPLLVHQVGRAWRLLTSEEFADDLASVRQKVHQDRLGPAGLEVLALVAYRQPILKADIDSVRGVRSGPHLRHLLDLRLVRILGRADVPGRPFLYGTTREFLDRFGLKDLKELPEAGRLAVPAEAEPRAEEAVADGEPATAPSDAAEPATAGAADPAE